MTEGRADVADKAAELRGAFDRSFAEPLSTAANDAASFLAIAIGGSPYLVDLSEITALFADTRIVRIASAARECLGVAALRGEVVPVYSLRALLGHHLTGEERPRWLALAGRGPVAAFAFDELDHHLRIPQADISPSQDEAKHRHIRTNAVVAGKPRPIIGIHGLMEHLQQRLDSHSRRKEH